jgi:hypothetical protein
MRKNIGGFMKDRILAKKVLSLWTVNKDNKQKPHLDFSKTLINFSFSLGSALKYSNDKEGIERGVDDTDKKNQTFSQILSNARENYKTAKNDLA